MAVLKEYFHPSNGSDYDAGTLTSKSQSFVAESSYTIAQVKLELKKAHGSPHHLYGVYLYDTTVVGLPEGAALVQFGSFYVDELSESYVEYSFSDDSVAITITNEYAIVVLTAEEVTTSNVYWYTSATEQYATGTAGKHNYIIGWSVLGDEHDRWFECYESGGGAPTKATNPTPADSDTGVDWSAKGLSWDDGGGSDTYNVYFGLTGSLSLISYAQVGTSITVDDDDITFPDTGEGEAGAVYYWRIDSTNGEGTTTGDEWNFDARPAKASVPSPADSATDEVLGLTTTWTEGATATTHNVLVDVGSGLESQETGLESGTWTPSPTIFDYIITYTWRVDSVNVYGITTGDEWTFTTIRLSAPTVTYFYNGEYYQLLIDSDGDYGSHPADGGVEDTDYVVVAYEPNFIKTTRKLVAIAENRFWYDDVT